MNQLELSGELAEKTVNVCRSKFGKFYELPPEKLYPDDNFREILRLPTNGWDMLDVVLSLEDTLEIAIYEEQVPDWAFNDITLGQWITELLSRLERDRKPS